MSTKKASSRTSGAAGDPINIGIMIQNAFPDNAVAIVLSHQFSSGPIEYYQWNNIGSNVVSPAVTVFGNTNAGHDYWTMAVVLSSGAVYGSFGPKTCTIEEKDKGLTFVWVVGPDGWQMPLESGGCTTKLPLLNDVNG